MPTNELICNHDFSLERSSSKFYKTFDFHAHSGFEILYFISGDVQYYLEEQAYTLVPGDLLVIPPNAMHRLVMLNGERTYSRYLLMLSEDYCKMLLKDVPHCFTDATMSPRRICLGDKEKKFFEQTMQQLTKIPADEFGQLERDSLSTLLLVKIQRLLCAMPQEQQQTTQNAQEILRYVNAHFTEPIRLDDIANHFFISKSTLARWFKQYTRTSIYKYITKKRILLAKALMKEKMPLNEISEACGFGSYACFYQAFVAETGVSPNQYSGSVHALENSVEEHRT